MLTEHRLQKQIVHLLRMYGFLVFQMDVMIALRFLKNQKDRVLFIKEEKALGYVNGTADLCIVMKNRVIFVEMKTEKGKQQESQKEFEKQVKELGHEYYIWRSVEDALQFIEKNK